MLSHDWNAIYITLKLAALTAILLLIICIPSAYLLSKSRGWYKPIIESLVTLPLVLPPAVLGFYFLVLFSPNHKFGYFIKHTLGIEMIFSFPGLVFASMIYSLPFTLRPLQASFEQLPNSLTQAAALLGFNRTQTFLKIMLPCISPAIFSAMTLSFAHTVGEFGLILMIGGNIPGETQVISLAIFEYVEGMNFEAANRLAFILLMFSFIIVFLSQLVNKKHRHYGLFN